MYIRTVRSLPTTFLDTSVPYDMNGQPILQRIYEGSNVLSYTQETSGNKKDLFGGFLEL